MKTISLEFAPVVKTFSFRSILAVFFQWLTALVAFPVNMIVASVILPVGKTLMEAVPPSGFLSQPMAFLFNGVINALILVWAGHRSTFKGLTMWIQLLV